MIAVVAFLCGLSAAVPLAFWVARGFRYTITVRSWRFDPDCFDAEDSASITAEVRR